MGEREYPICGLLVVIRKCVIFPLTTIPIEERRFAHFFEGKEKFFRSGRRSEGTANLILDRNSRQINPNLFLYSIGLKP